MEYLRSEDGPAPIGPYSQAVRAGNEIFCSGMIALDPQTAELTGADAPAQAEQALRNLAAVLSAGNATLAHVVKTTVYLIDMADFPAVNEVYARHFEESKPARSTVAVRALPKGALVEIDAIARV
ncbi:MAG: Rid family detoxifying hydrolase [Candidatus Baltobacteraceae bacterium]